MDFNSGRVQSVRPGYNPKYGDFSVIHVDFEASAAESEYVSDFPYTHPLNRPLEELFGKSDDTLSEADLVKAVGKFVIPKLENALAKHDDFVTFDGMWFLHELLPDMHVGFLNLAEALIDQGHHPLAAREILADLDLHISAPIEAQLFALNLAIGRDERFDNVSLNEDPVWFLRALEPQAAFKRPALLTPAFTTTGGEFIGSTLLEFVEQVGDELDSIADIAPSSGDIRIEMTFPHLYSGTLPASDKLLQTTVPTSFADEFKVNIDRLKEAVTPRTKAVLLNYPSNPTGNTLPRELLEKVAELAMEHNFFIISDEIYSAISYEKEHWSITSIPEVKDRTIYLNGFSKSHAMTGWRLGYIAGPEYLVDMMLKIHQYTALCAPSLSQYAAVEALSNSRKDVKTMRAEYMKRRNFIVTRFRDAGLPCLMPEGAFYVFPDVSPTGMNGREFSLALLKAEKVAVVPGVVFGECGNSHIRCSYATSMENIREAMDRIEKFCRTIF